MSDEHVKEIGNISFGILSREDILGMSVCKVNTTKLTGQESGSVYDERMGSSLESDEDCVTCGLAPMECPGHFGHIELNEYIINPLYNKMAVAFLRCFCKKCSRLLLMKEQIQMRGLNRYKQGERKFLKVMGELKKIDICCHCGHPQPDVSYSTTDNVISLVYKEKLVTEEQKSKGKKSKGKNTKISISMTVEEIKNIFDSVITDDLDLLGIDHKLTHPKNIIMSVFPVPPPCMRPYVVADGATICDDDLTTQLIEIIKANNQLAKSEEELSHDNRQKYIQSLKFRIATYFDNTAGKAKHPMNGRPIKCIKQRLSGKKGLLRDNLMGKRVDQSGRTVIGPDPTLKMGEMAMPREVAANLTRPVRVAHYNIKMLEKLVNDGKANEIVTKGADGKEKVITVQYALYRKGTELLYGDVIVRDGKEIEVKDGDVLLKPGDKLKRDGKFVKVRYPEKKRIKLNIGDVVKRQLQDGDIVLLNRQPKN